MVLYWYKTIDSLFINQKVFYGPKERWFPVLGVLRFNFIRHVYALSKKNIPGNLKGEGLLLGGKACTVRQGRVVWGKVLLKFWKRLEKSVTSGQHIWKECWVEKRRNVVQLIIFARIALIILSQLDLLYKYLYYHINININSSLNKKIDTKLLSVWLDGGKPGGGCTFPLYIFVYLSTVCERCKQCYKTCTS